MKRGMACIFCNPITQKVLSLGVFTHFVSEFDTPCLRRVQLSNVCTEGIYRTC